jgi:hypothetical protein
MNDTINTFDQVNAFRFTIEAQQFADTWVQEAQDGETDGKCHMNLLAWQQQEPLKALGLTLNLIDRTIHRDDALAEQVALGPVVQIVEQTGDCVTRFLRDALDQHDGFRLYTSWMRKTSTVPSWTRLS